MHASMLLVQLGEGNEPRARSLALQYAVVCSLQRVNARKILLLKADTSQERRAFVNAERRINLENERRVREFAIAPFIAEEIDCRPT